MAARPNTHRRNVRAVTPIGNVGRNVASVAIAAGLVFGGGALASADETKSANADKATETAAAPTTEVLNSSTVNAQAVAPTAKIPAVQVKNNENFGTAEVPADQIKVEVPVERVEAPAPEQAEVRQDRRANRSQTRRSVREEQRQGAGPETTEGQASPQSAPPSVASNSIIATAMSGTGVPYVWGGTSRSGWDCSGFVQWVFRQHGINLPRVASAQAAYGRRIPASEARPGDLMYKPGHIAIYAGNGMLIDAGNKRVGTSYRKIYRGNWSYHRVTK